MIGLNFNQVKQGILLFFLLFSVVSQAQVLVADINQDNQDSDPDNLASNKDVLVFTANSNEGFQLFRLRKGEGEPEVLLSLEELGDRLWAYQMIDSSYYFLMGDAHRRIYQKINVYTGEYSVLMDVPGNVSTAPGDFTRAGNTVFFTHPIRFANAQLWGVPLDGDTPRLIREFPSNAYPKLHITFQDELIIGVNNEIWKSDGTFEGTIAIANPDPANSPGNFGNFGFLVLGDYFYFTAYAPEYGYEIWQSDGTSQGTEVYQDYNPGAANGVLNIKQLRDELYFIPIDTIPGVQIYKDDLEMDSSVLFFDQAFIPEEGYVEDFFEVAGAFYIVMRDFYSSYTLWQTDGTQGGTQKLKDKVRYKQFSDDPGLVKEIGGVLYFVASGEGLGRELWKTDGTPEGTSLVKDIYTGRDGSGIDQMIVLSDRLFFSAQNADFGKELWSSDGTTANTTLVKDLNSNESGDSYPHSFFEFDSTLFFAAAVNCLGAELFRTNGTASTTRLVKDILPGRGGSAPRGFFVFKDQLFFTAEDGAGERPFWKSDGTADSTSPAFYSDINDPTNNTISPPSPLGDQLIIRSFLRDTGLAILSSDGTQEGTEIIKAINGFQVTGSGIGFVPIIPDSLLLFEAMDEELDNVLWRTDGTREGTHMIKAFPGSNGLSHFVSHNGLAFFKVSYLNASNGSAFWWRTDGTANGTFQIGPAFGDAKELVANSSGVYFTQSIAGTTILFKTDGLPQNTIQIPFDEEGSHLQSIWRLQIFNDKIYFYGDDGVHGLEPWTYDLTAKRWSLLKDINPGSLSGGIGARFYPIGDYLCFFAEDETHGRELWQTDGATENTVLVKDLSPGPGSSTSTIMYPYQGFLYFSANGGSAYGYELFKYSPYDKDNDGYLPGVDADDNDPMVNVEESEDPTAIDLICSTDGTITAISNINGAMEISVYPNPTADQIRVDVADREAYEVYLLSALGQRTRLSGHLVESDTYDLSSYPSGAYYLILADQKGRIVALRQIQKY